MLYECMLVLKPRAAWGDCRERTFYTFSYVSFDCTHSVSPCQVSTNGIQGKRNAKNDQDMTDQSVKQNHSNHEHARQEPGWNH